MAENNKKAADRFSPESRMERKLSLAQERDTRVVITRTNDTHRVLDIVRSADRGIRLIRANLLLKYQPSEVLPLLEEYQGAVEKLHQSTAKICALVGVPYRAPQGMEEVAIAGDGKKARNDKKIDSRMDVAFTTVFGE